MAMLATPLTTPDDLVITPMVADRPRRPIAARREAEAFHELSTLMLADASASIRRFLELSIALCRAGSAGLSLLGEKDGEAIFEWNALAGVYASHVGGTVPRNFSPCGLSLDAGRTIAVSRPGRLFSYLNVVNPPIVEGVVVPLYDAERRPLGSLWVVHHDDHARFCADDLLVMERLSVQLVLALTLRDEQAAARKVVHDRRDEDDARAAEKTELLADNAALVEIGGFLTSVLAASEDSIKVLDLDGRVAFMNASGLKAMDIEHFAAVRNRPWSEFWPGDGAQAARDAWLTARDGGSARFRTEARTAKGTAKFWDVQVTPIVTADGRVTHVLAISRDITEQMRMEAQKAILADELEHRIKNILAVVAAIARQTLRPPANLEDAAKAFNSRLNALGQAQIVVTRTNWTAADLREVVESVLPPFRAAAGDGRFNIEGPPVQLLAQRALSLALAVHELATNAVKYGALSTESGHVDLVWSVEGGDEKPMLRMEWREHGGPPVAEPGRQGFGSRLIERALPSDFLGTARIEYAPAGLVFTLTAPLERATGAHSAP